MKNSDLSGTSPVSKQSTLRDGYSLAAVLLITAVTYLGTLRFGFVYDDFQQILTNPFIKAWRYVPQYFVTSVWKQLFPFDPGNYYRPLFLLWARLNYSVFANRPLGWHATAIALHLLVTWLVFLVVRKMTGRSTAAWLTALIFGLHPIHHEVVAWVSGTTESLFAAFFLAAFLAYLKWKESSKAVWLVFSCGLYGLALLCKETAIVLPAIVFAHSWMIDDSAAHRNVNGYGRRLIRALISSSFYIPVALIYLAARYQVLSGLGQAVPNASFSAWLMTLPSVLLFYVKNWFFPVGLAEDYDLFYQMQPNFTHVLLPALILIMIAIAIWILWNYMGSRDAGFAAAWIMIPLLPALDFVVFRGGELVHDRYFYVPSIGAALFVALAIERAAPAGRAVFGQPLHAVAAALILAIVLPLCTIRATSFWKDDYILFSRAHEIAPRNLNAIDNLGVDLIERQQIDRAQTLFDVGLQEDGSNALFLFNQGRVQYIKKNYAKAEEYTKKAISSNPYAADSYVSLGKIQLKTDRPIEAANSFRRSVELNPYEPHFHTSYGIVLALNGDCSGAIAQFGAALALSPDDTISKVEMARCRDSESASRGNSSGSLSSPIRWGFDATKFDAEPAGK